MAAIGLLRDLEREVVALLEAFQAQGEATAPRGGIGRTQMQDAALTTLGPGNVCYADAFARIAGASINVKSG
ncbi:MAG: hypothetical protein R2864_15130 [Syntrophotaleaceae bacterium]